MEHCRRTVLASLALFAVGCFAGNVHREPGHLRTAAASEETSSLKVAVEASISNLALAPPFAAANEKEAGKGDTEGKAKQPVQVQVPEEAVKHFVGLLSKSCATRFTQMLHGKGPQMHTFGSHEMKATEESCAKLKGSICVTQARISNEKKSVTNGRSLDQTIQVSGDSCLPQECMSKSDLSALTNFMHQQAKSTVPGDEHQVELKVDCSKSGGVAVVAGVPAPVPAKSGSRPVSQILGVLSAISALCLL